MIWHWCNVPRLRVDLDMIQITVHRDPATPSRTTNAHLDCVFVENTLVFIHLEIGGGLPFAPLDELTGQSLDPGPFEQP